MYIFVGMSANADIMINKNSLSLDKWNTFEKREQKFYEVGAKILDKNKIPKRIIFYLNQSPLKSINAFTSYRDKGVILYPELY